MLHRLIALPLAVLASLVLATAAGAGGWAQVTVTNAPTDPPAGGGTPIELSVLQHGVTPVSWPTLTVVATDATSGTVVRADAKAEGAEGTYVASIVFPTAGNWNLTFESAELDMSGSAAVSVAPPGVAAQPAAATTAASNFDAAPLLFLLIAAAVALAIAGFAFKGRRALGTRQVSVRT